jgi:MFS family permease
MRFFEEGELKLLWPFYLRQIFFTIFFIYSAFYIIYLRDIEISLFQIGMITSVFAISSILFEIPTGAIADIFGRKFSTVLGYMLSGISITLIYFFKDFYSIILIIFCWGAVSTLISGASDAWVVDLLKSKNKKKLIDNYYIKMSSFYAFGCLLSGIVGSILVKQFGLSIIWPISGGSLTLSAVTLFFGKEEFIKKKLRIKEHFFNLTNHIKTSLIYSFKHKAILRLLLIEFLICFFIGFVGDMTWYPLLQKFGLKEYLFGYFFSLTFILSIFIPYSTKFLSKKAGGHVNYLIAVVFSMLVLLIITFFVNNLILALIICLLFFTTWDFYNPIIKVVFQKFLQSKTRATITSLQSMIASIGIMVSFPIAGFLADKIGVQNTLTIGGILLIPIILLFLDIKKKW